ncbi:peptidoglycan-binding domain-containing protein [Alsobacter sp. R-9]
MPNLPMACRGAALSLLLTATAAGTATTATAQGFFDIFGPRYYPAPQGAMRGEKRLSVRDTVRVQEALADLGLYRGELDGILGPGTRDAIAAYQARSRQRPTGYLTQRQFDALMATLEAPPPAGATPPRPGAAPPAVSTSPLPPPAAAAPPTAAAAAPPAAADGSVAPAAHPSAPGDTAREPLRDADVLGLKLGMDLDEAERLLREQMPDARVLTLAPPAGSPPVAFGHARVLVRGDGKESIALVTEPERSGPKVLAIGRYLFEGAGAIDRAGFIADLEAKYGAGPDRDGALLRWGGGAPVVLCRIDLGGLERGTWTDSAGPVTDWRPLSPPGADPSFRGPASMNWAILRGPTTSRPSAYERCGPTVTAWVPDAGGRTGEFSLWLVDAKAYVAAMSQPATAAAPAPAAEPPRARPRL